MKSISLPNTMNRVDERTSPTLMSALQSTLLVFLLFFPVTFMSMFLHEAGHALFHLSQGVPVDFLYAHPFSFVGFVRPMADYNSVWVHASGTVFELLVSGVIFVILWKHRSYYTLPFLMVFPWVALYDGMGGIFDILGHTGDYHNILTITGWSPVGFYISSLILIIFGIFFLLSLFPLLGLKPQDRKALFVLPIGMLLFTAFGLPVAYYLVPGSPIDVQYHVAHEIILSAYYRPLFMGAIGIFLSLVYITLYRKLYRRIPLSLRTELTSLSWRDFLYPGLLFVICMVLGFMVIL
jgi:hypothetical protein